MQHKKHSTASNMKAGEKEPQVNNTSASHMPDPKSPGPKVSEKDARAAFASSEKNLKRK